MNRQEALIELMKGNKSRNKRGGIVYVRKFNLWVSYV